MLNEILEEAAKLTKKEQMTINLAILIDNAEDVLLAQIKELAEKVKNLKIITKNISRFSYIEEELYVQYGIAMQITNNRIKALLNTDIIINFDFNESRINEYEIPDLVTIINIQNAIQINKENYKGKIINNYKIDYDKELLEGLEDKKDFDNNVLYESLIYRKDTYSNIKSQLFKDNVRILLNPLTKI